MLRRLALVPLVCWLAVAALVPAQSATAADTITIGGVIDGSDGRAVNALLGLDLKDSSGRTLASDGCPQVDCPFSGYGLVVNINQGKNGQPKLTAEGSSDTSTAVIRWSADVPAATRVVYLEAYPQDETLHTNEARYGHAMRHNFAVPTSGDIDVHLPLICPQGGSTGSIRGTAVKDGQPLPLKRVVAWSMDQYDATVRPTLGWNIGTANSDGTFVVPNLASGQKYQLWTTAADAADGTPGQLVKTTNVQVDACTETARDVSFDPPPSAPPAPPPPPAPTVESGSSLITAGRIATLSGAADPGTTVELLAYSQPSTTYSVIRRTTATSTGSYSFSVMPQTNTRLLVRINGQRSSSVVVGVRPAISLRTVRTGLRSYQFTGRVQPIRVGQIVSVFAQTPSGNVLVGRGRVGSEGIWSATHRFTGNGTFGLFAVTGADMVNAAGRSATVSTAVR